MELTGNLGNVMKESAMAALPISAAAPHSLELNGFSKYEGHPCSFPGGGCPEGRSFGRNRHRGCDDIRADECSGTSRLRHDREITLRGRVLPIGGLKEKTMAALRNGLKNVIIPTENESTRGNRPDGSKCAPLYFSGKDRYGDL